ncbi:tRNA 2-thiouridine(34) synthase MnmA [Candidatus Saccharibacteria bacterium]|nr:tRNA 2-thiouridine(34) synthase MnmA [Candidatus Saccharibacteria bacterium]
MSRVFVGMSGGVDSSVSAAILQQQGHDVVGVYMKNWTEDLPGMHCPWADDLADAKRVAVKLGIDLRIYDFQKQYKDRVVDYMLAEYKAGRTPNPDIMCNQEVKFKLFLEASLEEGADLIATGHYASARDGRLYMAKDSNKDQTYFLYRVTADSLKKSIFPLGEFVSKTDVRNKAKEFGLVNADKKDSQGICFVGKVGIRDFLSSYVETRPGVIIDVDTKAKVGQHDGAIYYTLGQRHGLDVGGGLPYYVVSKDMKLNIVYVSRNLSIQELWQTTLTLSDIHGIQNGGLSDGEYLVRIRHRAPLVSARLTNNNIEFNRPQRALTPGQSIVFYRDDECLGGGIIE